MLSLLRTWSGLFCDARFVWQHGSELFHESMAEDGLLTAFLATLAAAAPSLKVLIAPRCCITVRQRVQQGQRFLLSRRQTAHGSTLIFGLYVTHAKCSRCGWTAKLPAA